MEIPEKLIKFKYHFITGLILSLAVPSLIYVAHRLNFLHILNYFWPLLASTALVLLAVVVIGKTTPTATDASGHKVGLGVLEYVAGDPEHPLEVLHSGLNE